MEKSKRLSCFARTLCAAIVVSVVAALLCTHVESSVTKAAGYGPRLFARRMYSKPLWPRFRRPRLYFEAIFLFTHLAFFSSSPSDLLQNR